jgi:hypothetical protein
VTAGVNTRVKGFANVCCKNKKGITEGVVCYKDKENKQGHKEVATSVIRVKLRRS